MTLRLGFTGTQIGMTERQKRTLLRKLKAYSEEYSELEIHHGDCIGADAEFHEIAIAHWPGRLSIVIHPPENSKKRAFCSYDEGQLTILSPKPYLERNRVIVDSVDEMLAAPKEEHEELRSGTWSTVRYSRKQKVKGTVLKP